VISAWLKHIHMGLGVVQQEVENLSLQATKVKPNSR